MSTTPQTPTALDVPAGSAKPIPCPECYGGHFRPCQVCGDTGWVEIVPGQIHACDCKRKPAKRQQNASGETRLGE